MNASHHHHRSIAPYALAVVLAGGAAIALSHSRAWHKEILATVDQADVLTAADMVPEKPAAGLPDRAPTARVQ